MPACSNRCVDVVNFPIEMVDLLPISGVSSGALLSTRSCRVRSVQVDAETGQGPRGSLPMASCDVPVWYPWRTALLSHSHGAPVAMGGLDYGRYRQPRFATASKSVPHQSQLIGLVWTSERELFEATHVAALTTHRRWPPTEPDTPRSPEHGFRAPSRSHKRQLSLRQSARARCSRPPTTPYFRRHQRTAQSEFA